MINILYPGQIHARHIVLAGQQIEKRSNVNISWQKRNGVSVFECLPWPMRMGLCEWTGCLAYYAVGLEDALSMHDLYS